MTNTEEDIRLLNLLRISYYILGGFIVLLASILLIQHIRYIEIFSSAPSASYYIRVYSPDPPSHMMNTIMEDSTARLLTSKLYLSYISSEVPTHDSLGIGGLGSFVQYGTVTAYRTNVWRASVMLVVGILVGLCLIILGYKVRQRKSRIFCIVIALTGWVILCFVNAAFVRFDQSPVGIRTFKIVYTIIHVTLMTLGVITCTILNKKSVKELYGQKSAKSVDEFSNN